MIKLFVHIRRSHGKMVCLLAFLLTVILTVSVIFFLPDPVLAGQGAAGYGMPWWAWPVILFIVALVLGIVAVLGGVGAGVLFVPVVCAFLPFHIDFVRGAGLIVALSGSLAASPALLRKGLADLRLSLPHAVIASTCSILGALIGLALPTNIMQISLGLMILLMVVVMLLVKKIEYPEVKEACALSAALKISGIYQDVSTGFNVNWQVHRTAQGLAVSALIGIMTGMFGLGADWANIPMLNLIMGAPLKVSVATSKFLLSITDTSAAWIYINNGAVLPIVIVPSVIGIMLGSVAGVKLLSRKRPASARYIVIAILLVAGGRILLKGFGI